MTPNLEIFSKSKPEKTKQLSIIADLHEKNSLVAAELIELGISVEFQHLKVADYIIGNIAIERKTCSDFISSMINKRLLRQLEELKQYEKRILVIEGLEEQELYNDENGTGMHSNSIRGMLLYTILETNTPIIFSKNYEDTAKFMHLIAKKLENPNTHMSLHAKKKARNIKEQRQYILEAFPGIGPAKAKNLLDKFGSLSKIVNAPAEELKEILKSKTDFFKNLLD